MRPAFRIVADSVNITPVLADRLVSLDYTDKAGVKSDTLTIVLDDRDQRLALPPTGATIELSIGYEKGPLARMGTFVVDEVEVSGPGRLLTISANAADMTGGIKAPKERSFHDITLGDLVKVVAGDNKLTPSVASELASIALGHVDQTESDMQLLTRICAERDAVCKVSDGRLVVAKHASGETTTGKKLPLVTVQSDQVGSWRVSFTDRGKYKSVEANWQDKGAAQRKKATAGSGSPALTLKQTYATEDEAKAAAQSKFKSLGRGTAKLSISGIPGNVDLAAERELLLVAFRAGVDGGNWIATSVTHSITDGGYTCSVEAERK